jgi:SAM-dependent methyltransferase
VIKIVLRRKDGCTGVRTMPVTTNLRSNISLRYQSFWFHAIMRIMSDSLIDRVVANQFVWHLVQNVLGYPEEKEAMYRSAVATGGRLLDFGCASGHLGRAFEGMEYVGVDSSEQAITVARKRWSNQPRMRWICANILDKPFAEGEFDQVLLGCTVHHLSDLILLPILRELAFCLRPGGRLHIFDPVFQETDGFAPRMLRKLDRGKYTRTLDQIVSAVKGTPLLEVERTATFPAPKSLWRDCDTGYVMALRDA